MSFPGQRPPPSVPGYKVFPQLVGRAPCARARKQALGAFTSYVVGVYVPQCNPDGSFKKIQCHQSTGYCWCVDEAGREMRRTRTRGKPTCDKGKQLFYKKHAHYEIIWSVVTLKHRKLPVPKPETIYSVLITKFYEHVTRIAILQIVLLHIIPA